MGLHLGTASLCKRDNLTKSLAGSTTDSCWQPGQAPSVVCVLWTTAGLVGTPSLSRRGWCGGTSPVRRLVQPVRSIDQNYLPAADAAPTWFPSRHEQVIFVAASRPARTTRKVMQRLPRTVVEWEPSRFPSPKRDLWLFSCQEIAAWERPPSRNGIAPTGYRVVSPSQT